MISVRIVERLRRLLNRPIKLWQCLVAVLAILLAVNFLQRLTETQHLEVKDLIRKVKDELVAADLEAIHKREAPLFVLKDFEMEIQFVVRRSGDLKAEVVGVGGAAGVGSESVQKLKLHWDIAPPRNGSVPPTESSSKAADVTIGPEEADEGSKSP